MSLSVCLPTSISRELGVLSPPIFVHVTYHGRGHGSVLHGPCLIASVAGKTTTTVVEERNNGLRLCLSCVTNSRTALAVIKNRRVNYLFIYYNVVHSVHYENTKVKHKKH